MASPVLQSSTPLTIPGSSIHTSLIPNTPHFFLNKKIKKPYPSVPNKVVSCKATQDGNQSPTHSSLNKFDRRDVLIGLGGLYGAANLAIDPLALADPMSATDLENCKLAKVTRTKPSPYGDTITCSMHTPCCPPKPAKEIIDFKPPPTLETEIRYRPPAHLVSSDYIDNFTRALKKMKELPDDDPRSFYQQGLVHCAYCHGAYQQVGFPNLDLQVHFSWLFFPFHRLYLYFFERILGHLIDDPNFAIPYWNWDAPAGMSIPAIYANPLTPLYDKNPLYDEKRNAGHQPPKLVDLDYNSTEKDITSEALIDSNLKVIYKEVVCSRKPSTFLGKEYQPGMESSPGGGKTENGSHTALHKWCGDPKQPFNEDMGRFYSAGKDPLFYAHHANVDRMWSIWKTVLKRKDFTKTDWLDSSFLFYDEEKNLVRAKVRDCLDTKTLGYDYQKVEIPWINAKPIPQKFTRKGGKSGGQAIAAEIKKKNVLLNPFPAVLDRNLSIEISRRRTSRSEPEKDDEEEVLVLEDIELEKDASVKFDIYINNEDDEAPCGPENSEFVGSFSNIPHNHVHGMSKLQTSYSLGISYVLEDLGIDGEKSIKVTLVPREGVGLVTVGNIKIDYIRE